jgi:DMSO reductase family type II enzyme chaperone
MSRHTIRRNSRARRRKHRRSRERALARSRVFGLLARALRYPDEDLFAALHSGRWAAELAAAARESGLRAGHHFFRELSRAADALPDALAALQCQHNALYSSGSVCPQQESDFVACHAFQKTDVMADVAGFYRAFGLRVSQAQRELPDVLGSELEFLHVVAHKEARAIAEGHREATDICRSAYRKFLAEHLAVWVGAYRARMESSPAGRFYVALARLTECFVTAQRIGPKSSPLTPPAAPPERFVIEGPTLSQTRLPYCQPPPSAR